MGYGKMRRDSYRAMTAPFADLLWMETKSAHLGDAKKFADAIHAKYPNKMLAYNCSPSFNWNAKLDFDFSKGIPEIQGDYNEHIGLIHNRIHTSNSHMLQVKKTLAKKGVTMIGLYAGSPDKSYEEREDAVARDGEI